MKTKLFALAVAGAAFCALAAPTAPKGEPGRAPGAPARVAPPLRPLQLRVNAQTQDAQIEEYKRAVLARIDEEVAKFRAPSAPEGAEAGEKPVLNLTFIANRRNRYRGAGMREGMRRKPGAEGREGIRRKPGAEGREGMRRKPGEAREGAARRRPPRKAQGGEKAADGETPPPPPPETPAEQPEN